jgi:hypothetical protein
MQSKLIRTSIVKGFATLVVVTIVAVISLSLVNRTKATGVIGKEDLAGSWVITLTGDTGCGISTIHLIVNLNSSGVGTVTNQSHTQGCGNSLTTGVFTITTMNSNGSGTAGLTCGAGCGFTFQIQVAPDRTVFNLVDVTDPNNFLEGVAIHQ